MIGSLMPVIYDFKRSFLRISTVLFLALFTLAGIGTSYLVINAIWEQFPSTNIMAVVVNVNGTCVMEGYVFDIAGNSIDAELEITGRDGDLLYKKSLYGSFHVEDKSLCKLFNVSSLNGKIRSSLGETSLKIEVIFYHRIHDLTRYGEQGVLLIYTGLVDKYLLTSAKGFLEESQFAPSESRAGGLVIHKFIIISRASNRARLIVNAVNFSNPDMFYPDLTIRYGLIRSDVGTVSGESGLITVDISKANISYRLLGELKDSYVGVYDLEISSEYNTLVLNYDYDNSTRHNFIYYGFLPDVESIYVQGLINNVGLSLFTQFFPIIFLYLAYILISKPRSTGALEFIIARPITRWDLYLTRFLAGVLTIIVSSALFIIANNIANYVLLGVSLDLYANTVLFLGLIAGLTSFYSLCYMVASSIRSGLYLAISIILYLLFSMFWGLLILIYSFTIGGGLARYSENLYLLSYLNPLSPAHTYAPYFVSKHYNISPLPADVIGELVNPVLAIVVPIAWITACFIIGYRVFRKINLTT